MSKEKLKIVSDIAHSVDFEGKEITTRCTRAYVYDEKFVSTEKRLDYYEDKYKSFAVLTGRFTYTNTRNPLVLEANFLKHIQENAQNFSSNGNKRKTGPQEPWETIPSKERKHYENDAKIIAYIDQNGTEDLQSYLASLQDGSYAVIDTDGGFKVFRGNNDILYKYTTEKVEVLFTFWVKGVAVTTGVEYEDEDEEPSTEPEPSTVKKIIPWALLLYLLKIS